MNSVGGEAAKAIGLKILKPVGLQPIEVIE